MINTANCPLYNLQSKKTLKRLLYVNNNNFLKQPYISSLINPYIEVSGKPRLIEAPHEDLKKIQRRIKQFLNQIIVPDNVFSGIQGRSYVDNTRLHMGNKNLFKIDLTAFFPSISRNTVYQFFHKDLACSADVAQILTNLTTIDLMESKSNNLEPVFKFLNSKNVSCYNHLISGAPTSQILSYLVNYHMFDEIQKCADSYHITVSIYVDDITFSSNNKISHKFREKIFSIIRKYKYKISKAKVKNYTKSSPKLVTGVIINPSGNLTIKNSLRLKIINEFKYLSECPDNLDSKKRLRGLLTAARQIEPHAYSSIYQYVK